MSSVGPPPIRDMFNALVPEYDRFNRISSLGLDTRWRRELARVLHEKKHILDIGTGTGDVAQELASSGADVVGMDFSERMIDAAREKLKNHRNVSFAVGSADDIPYPPGTFDGVTSAFVIRNLHHGGVLSQAFREFYRVLTRGGIMVHLELTRPPAGFVSWGHHVYVRSVLPLIGRWFFGQRWPQDYLSSTIHRFPVPQEICQRMRWAGFDQISHYSLSGGIASLFCGVKC